MQNIILEQPYRFVPPVRGRVWPAILTGVLKPYLRYFYAVASHEVRDAEKLRASLDAGHGIVLSGNHSRPCDPMAIGWLSRAVHHPFFCMASWHTFMNSKVNRFLIRRCGAFSINREATDHASLTFAIDALVTTERPVVIFPEGTITRTNDRLAPLLEGLVFAARMAAKRRAKQTPPGRVVIHPVAFKYFFQGDLAGTLEPVLARLEARLGSHPPHQEPLVERVRRLENAYLRLREVELFGEPQRPADPPPAGQWAQQLVERILQPLAEEWAPGETRQLGLYARVQFLRSRILPDMIAGKMTEQERARRWGQLRDLYLAQTLQCHPPNFLEGNPSAEQTIEAVERVEEDLTDVATPHGPLHLVIQVGDAIEVEPRRERGTEQDPLLTATRDSLAAMLASIRLTGGSAATERNGVPRKNKRK